MSLRPIPVAAAALGLAATLAVPPAAAQQAHAQQPPRATRVAATVPAAPARAAFDALLQRCRDAFDARPLTEVAYAASRDGGVKRSYAPVEIRTALQPTPSPVAPFVAQVTVVELASAQPGPDFDTTRALDVPMDHNVLRSEGRMHLAYQQGQWRLLGVRVVLQVKPDPDTEFETVRAAQLEPQAAAQLDGPLGSCAMAMR